MSAALSPLSMRAIRSPQSPAALTSDEFISSVPTPAAAGGNGSLREITALAFWRRSSKRLSSFNTSFALLLNMLPSNLAACDVTWETFLFAEDSVPLVHIINTLRPAEPYMTHLRLIAADGTVYVCEVSITLIVTNGDEEELLWTFIPDRTILVAPVPPLVLPKIIEAKIRRPSSGSSFSGSEEEEAESFETQPYARGHSPVPSPRLRQPWEANLVKFSIHDNNKKRESPPPEDRKIKKQVSSPEI